MKQYFFPAAVLLWTLLFSHVSAAEESTGNSHDPNLLFEANFDQYNVNASYARGDNRCRSFSNPDLQLRMFPGTGGRGNAVNLDNSERCEYAAQGNFDAKQGTVTIWLAPQNWKPSEQNVQVFFEANLLPAYRLLVYKNNYPNCFYALIEFPGAPGSQKSFFATSYLPDSEWTPGKWHRLDATWDSEYLKLYVDGLQTRNFKWHRSTVKFPSRLSFPEGKAHNTITIGMPISWKGNKFVNVKHKSAFDLVRIYDRVLPASEIKADYEKTVPSVFGKSRSRNLLSIPETQTAPSIDGKLSPGEWENAASVPVNELMGISEYRSTLSDAAVFLLRDNTNLYLALYSTFLPKHARINKRDGNLWEDDSFEFHLKKPNGNIYQFIFNGNGEVFDARNADPRWNTDLKAASNTKGGAWCLEAAIPIRDLDSFKASDVWEGGFFLSFLQEKGGHCYQTWNDAGKSMFSANLGEIRFGKNDESFTLSMPRKLENGNFELELRKHSSGTFKTEASLLAENGEKIEFKGDLFSSAWKTPLPAGNYRLSVMVSNTKKETVLRHEKYFTVNRPLELKYSSFPSRSFVDVSVDFSNAGMENRQRLSSAGIEGKIELVRDGKSYSAVSVNARKIKTSAELPLKKDLPPGTYAIRATFGTLTSEAKFRIPDMTPYKRRIAADDSVPPPWIPIEKSGPLSFRVLDREYFFGNSPAPVKVTSGNSTVLDRPVEWIINGKTVKWNTPSLLSRKEDHTVLAGTGTADGFTFSWRGELWFDGLYKLTFDMSPPESGSNTVIRSFQLAWSVPAEFARYVLSPTLLPWKNNSIEAKYEILQPNTNRDFFIWTTGVEKGFLWWPKSNANWVNAPGEKQLKLTRKNGRAEIRASIISRRAELRKKAEYTFVFMGTPVKRLPADARFLNVSGWGRIRHTKIQIMGWNVFQPNESAEDCTSAAGHVPAHPEKFDTVPERWRKRGIIPYLYGMPAQIATVDAEYDYFFPEWAKTPTYVHTIIKNGLKISNEPCCGHTQVTDLIACRADALFRNHPAVGGLYYDLSDVRFCENPYHGCGGIDAFGKPYLSSIALNLRAFFMRIYKVTRKYDKRMMLHAHNLFNPVAHSFSDSWWPGEQCYTPLAANIEHYYCEGISPEELQSEFNDRIKGVALSLLPQYGRVSWPKRGFPEHQKRYKEYMFGSEYAIRTMTPMMVHDVNISAEMISWPTVDKWWDIREKLKFDKAVFHGYWFDDTLSTRDPKVYASWYELSPSAPYRRLIIVSNFARDARKASLQFEDAKLGIPENATFTDLWENKPLTRADLREKRIPGNHFLLIGVK